MATGLNKWHGIGNLGRDPEVRFGQSGTAVCNLNLAVNERKKEGDNWVEHVEWVRVSCFGKTAEHVGEYLKKGSQVYVEGRMQTRKYTDKEGAEKYSTEIAADRVLFLGGKGEGAQGASGRGQSKSPLTPQNRVQSEARDSDGFEDDSLPF